MTSLTRLPARPRILFLHSSNELYGADRSLVWLVRSVADIAEPIVVLPDDLPYEGGLATWLRAEGIEVLVGHLPVMRRGYLAAHRLPSWLIRAVRDTLSLIALARSRDVAGIVTNTSGVMVGPLVARAVQRPHIWYLREIVNRPRWYRWLVRTNARLASGKVVTVSSAVARWIGTIPGRGPEIGYNGVDTDEPPRPLPQARTVLFVGRLNTWKGHDVFLAAATRIHEKAPDVRFRIVGGVVPADEETPTRVRSEISGRDPSGDWLEWVGEVADARRSMREAWIVTVPSTQPDPLPNVVLEAMAEGRAVVGSRLGGIPEMIEDGVTGCLVTAGSATDLADAILWLLDDSGRCAGFGQAGYERARSQFSRQKSVGNWRRRIVSTFHLESHP